MLVRIGETYADIIDLSPAQARLLATAQPLNGFKGIRPKGPQWKAVQHLLQKKLVKSVFVKHVACSLGEFKLTKLGRRVLDAYFAGKVNK